MTYSEFNTQFKYEDLQHIADMYEKDGIPDRPARREAYNNKMDAYCRDGLVTENQANKWYCPTCLETTKYWL